MTIAPPTVLLSSSPLSPPISQPTAAAILNFMGKIQLIQDQKEISSLKSPFSRPSTPRPQSRVKFQLHTACSRDGRQLNQKGVCTLCGNDNERINKWISRVPGTITRKLEDQNDRREITEKVIEKIDMLFGVEKEDMEALSQDVGSRRGPKIEVPRWEDNDNMLEVERGDNERKTRNHRVEG